MCLTGVFIVVVHLWLVGQRANRIVVRVVPALSVARHRGVVEWRVVAVIVRLVVAVVLGAREGTGRWSAGTHRGSIVDVIVDREIGKGRLGKGLGDELSLLVLEMGKVASRLLLGQSGSLGQALLVPPFDDLGDALVNFVTAVFLRRMSIYTRANVTLLKIYLEVTLNVRE